MPKLPQVKPKELVRLLEKRGFVARKTKSGHVFFQHPGGRTTIVSIHNKPLAKGTLSGILKQTGISVDELIDEI
ncbi:TPA: hypothetical protein DCZ81_03860 [Candidatus Collierbacteria bacterium]|uniref:YcfA family protein n=1 Tax=Candidatus Amesbacteria bacterium GW2011_GWC2_47_8 TaxID=1618367 RepID=A0A0G1TSW2_9BACT|nr:MAG: YcfA family protein [Candidatus Amesbacteria bacterium GW2011_GWC2_47_8]HBC45276.1 hypothetical protein [Candidatus Collierbacteria bacterium]